MDEKTERQLLDINRQFYQTFALEFSRTRQRIQPGVKSVLDRLPSGADLLDLGCGNGELWRHLMKRGHQGRYVGLDFSPGLLQAASASGDDPQADRRQAYRRQAYRCQATFIQADLAGPDWDEAVLSAAGAGGFDYALAFAFVHHIPGKARRQAIFDKIHRLLAPGGRLIHSEWQFLNSPRLRERVQPWEAAGLSPDAVDEGDYLLDWRHGGYGLRYVHHFSQAELEEAARRSGFQVLETFYSDGEGGRLGLYQIWQKSGNSPNASGA